MHSGFYLFIFYFFKTRHQVRERGGEREVQVSEMPFIPVESSREGECLVCVKLKD